VSEDFENTLSVTGLKAARRGTEREREREKERDMILLGWKRSACQLIRVAT
jgi:hypothetical protein